MSIKALKNQVARLRAAAGVDRCACEGQQLKNVVIFPGDTMPASFPSCPHCGRSLVLVVEVSYVEAAPPDWFVSVQGAIDEAELMQRWQQYMVDRCKHGIAPIE